MIAPTLLESERLIYRPVGPADLADMTALFTHEGVTEFMALLPELKTPEGVKKFVAAVDASHRAYGPVVLLSIRWKDSGKFAGACGLAKTPDVRWAECLYAVAPEFHGQGVATEAVERLLRYAFLGTDVPEVIAHVLPANRPSIRVLEKIAASTGMAAKGLVDHPLYPEKILLFSTTRDDFLKTFDPE